MEIIKRETIRLSENEAKAYELMCKVVDNIYRNTSNPNLTLTAGELLDGLYDLGFYFEGGN